MTGHIVELEPQRLAALCNVYSVDGRVSWHPPDIRGFAPMNCYLLREPEAALLVDTGVTVHEQQVLEQLSTLLGSRTDLAVLLLRQGEFDSICNLYPLVRAFGVKTVYGQFPNAIGWSDVRAERRNRLANDPTLADTVSTVVVRREGEISLGADRRLTAFLPLLRLLKTHWVYDEAPRTLFTSDSFSYVVRDEPGAAWVVDAETDATTLDTVVSHLLGGRFWWLANAQVDPLRRSVAEVFERFPITTIAPAYGCILQGETVVARHYALLDSALDIAARGRPLRPEPVSRTC